MSTQTEPLTTLEVVRRLSELSKKLAAKTDEIAVLDEAAVRARAAHEVAYARAFLTCDGPMDIRKQTAIEDCADLKFAAELAEQKVRAAREAIRTLRDQLDVGRSIGAATRAEFAASGWGQP